MARWLRDVVGMALMMLLLGAVPPRALAAEHVVEMIGVSFSPANIQIIQGDVVRWVNNSGLLHTATSGAGCSPTAFWDSGLLDPGRQFSFTFNIVGTFPYYCIPHCLIGMVGSVEVDGPVSTIESTWGKIKSLFRHGDI